MNPDDFTEPQRLALAYIVGGERQKTRGLKQRDNRGDSSALNLRSDDVRTRAR